jgi:hypothetical protein
MAQEDRELDVDEFDKNKFSYIELDKIYDEKEQY